MSHKEMLPKKSKNFVFGNCTSYDVSGSSSTKACKTLLNQNLIAMLQIEANQSKKMLSRRNLHLTSVTVNIQTHPEV